MACVNCGTDSKLLNLCLGNVQQVTKATVVSGDSQEVYYMQDGDSWTDLVCTPE